MLVMLAPQPLLGQPRFLYEGYLLPHPFPLAHRLQLFQYFVREIAW